MDLKTFLDLQRELQVEGFNLDPTQLEGDDLEAFVLWNLFALEDELHEAAGEVSWKPWARGHRFDREAFLGELVDALHFLGNLLLVAVDRDSSKPVLDLAMELSDRYQKKRELNLQRQREGYDGVSTKCRGCRRALDTEKATTVVDGQTFCRGCGRLVPT